MDDTEKMRLRALAGFAFSPGTPIDNRSLLAGRLDEVRRVIRAITARGRHVIMYGQRGVGKTSLASVFKQYFDEIAGMRFYKVNCGKTDGFDDVWRRMFSEIPVLVENKGDEPHINGSSAIEYRLDQLVTEDGLSPGDMRRIIQKECQGSPGRRWRRLDVDSH